MLELQQCAGNRAVSDLWVTVQRQHSLVTSPGTASRLSGGARLVPSLADEPESPFLN